MNKKILILGSSSFVGRHLFSRLGEEKAIGTYCCNSIKDGIFFDSTTMSIPEIIKNPKSISHAVILLGDTNPETCVADIHKSRLINVVSIKKIIDELKELGIKPIFTSSEFIFDGKEGFIFYALSGFYDFMKWIKYWELIKKEKA